MKIGFNPIVLNNNSITQSAVSGSKTVDNRNTAYAKLPLGAASYGAKISFGKNAPKIEADISAFINGSMTDIPDTFKGHKKKFRKALMEGDSNRVTPIHGATENTNSEVMKTVYGIFKGHKKELQAALVAEDANANMPLHNAARNENPDVMNYVCRAFEGNEDELRDAMFIPNTSDETPYDIAYKEGAPETRSIIEDLFEGHEKKYTQYGIWLSFNKNII